MQTYDLQAVGITQKIKEMALSPLKELTIYLECVDVFANLN